MVTYARPHVLFRVLGVFGASASSPVDVWGIGLRIDVNVAGTVTEAQKATFLTAMKSPAVSFHSTPDIMAGQSCYVTTLTAAYVGTDGRYVGGDTQPTTTVPVGPQAGAGSVLMPWEIAQVFTLRTLADRGRAHVGRFYYPCQRAVDTGGKWPSGPMAGILTAVSDFLNAVNTQAKGVWPTSRGITVFSPLGTRETHIVRRVEIGNAPDTQRRRGNKIVESYQGQDLTTAVPEDIPREWVVG